MSQKLKSVKGTRDLLPPETSVWEAVETNARRVFGSYGYREIRTPVMESTDLFVRGVGEASDIVGKEMYTFDDRKGRSLTLRPENTAAVARAFVQHGMREWPSPVKLFYIGPQFRYERPQRGRYRQFHQIGAELIGDEGPHSDVELLVMLVRFLRSLRFEDLVVRLNTVGDAESRRQYAAALREFLEPHRADLGDDSKRRLETNPLRILDTKNPAERALLESAPELESFLSEECRQHFSRVREGLERHAVEHQIEPRLVRGLDYYTRTVFEISSAALGAQDAILGGGRYDGLVSELGGAPEPGIGFAIGQDRLIDVLPDSFRSAVRPAAPVLVVPIGDETLVEALQLAEELRDGGLDVVTELRARAMKAALGRADRLGARWVVLVGTSELESGMITVKDFADNEQFETPRAELGEWLRSRS